MNVETATREELIEYLHGRGDVVFAWATTEVIRLRARIDMEERDTEEFEVIGHGV